MIVKGVRFGDDPLELRRAPLKRCPAMTSTTAKSARTMELGSGTAVITPKSPLDSSCGPAEKRKGQAERTAERHRASVFLVGEGVR